jgi:hypothetical protein
VEDFEKVNEAYKLLSTVNNPATRLWRIAWGIAHRQQMSFQDLDTTQKFIDQYSYDWVREAFEASNEHQVYTLAYVRGILTKRKQQEAVDKAKAYAKEKQTEVAEITGEKIRPKTDLEAKKWTGLFDEFKK